MCRLGSTANAVAGVLPDQRRERRPARTLIIADEGSQVHYIEGCSAPVYSSDSLHCRGRDRGQATARDVHHNPELVTQRLQPRHQASQVEAMGHMEWIDGNIGPSSP